MAVGGVQLELLLTEFELARDGERLDLAQRERGVALNVELGVEVPQLALRGAGLRADPQHAGLPDAQRQAGEGEAAEQMVEVGVRGQERVHLEAGLVEHGGQERQLVGQVGRVDQHGLGPGPDGDRIGLPDPAGQNQNVLI